MVYINNDGRTCTLNVSTRSVAPLMMHRIIRRLCSGWARAKLCRDGRVLMINDKFDKYPLNAAATRVANQGWAVGWHTTVGGAAVLITRKEWDTWEGGFGVE